MPRSEIATKILHKSIFAFVEESLYVYPQIATRMGMHIRKLESGEVIRLEIQMASSSGASSATIPLGIHGGVSAGQTKRYQCWYRTTVAPPCGLGVNDFNLSNGYEVVWSP